MKSLFENHRELNQSTVGIDLHPSRQGNFLLNPATQKTDVSYISYLDNVASPKIQKEITALRKILVGKLILLQKEVFELLPQLEKRLLAKEDIDYCTKLVKEEFFIDFSISLGKFSREGQNDFLYKLLNKPMRVCGVVPNNCQFCGSAFWAIKRGGAKSLQMVKKSEIDNKDEIQRQIFKEATHFNPVEICFSLKNYKGGQFDMKALPAEKNATNSQKNQNGHKKLLDKRPLWHAMGGNYNTIFVEIDPANFCHLESIVDLLNNVHQ